MMFHDMMGAAMEASPGQAVFTASAVWTVPAGVTRASMVCVQPGGSSAATQVEVDGVVVCRALNGSRIGDGGGEGGDGGFYVFDGSFRSAGGGGGAGGYAGNGGVGGTLGSSAGKSDSGGNGGKSGRPISDSFPDSGSKTGSGGGGIGLNGIGSSPATTPNGLAGGSYGGGAGGQDQASSGSKGGACAWRNDVTLAPGRQIHITVPAATSWPPRARARCAFCGAAAAPIPATQETCDELPSCRQRRLPADAQSGDGAPSRMLLSRAVRGAGRL